MNQGMSEECRCFACIALLSCDISFSTYDDVSIFLQDHWTLLFLDFLHHFSIHDFSNLIFYITFILIQCET